MKRVVWVGETHIGPPTKILVIDWYIEEDDDYYEVRQMPLDEFPGAHVSHHHGHVRVTLTQPLTDLTKLVKKWPKKTS